MHDPQCQQLKTFEDGACKYLISGSKGIMDRLLSGSCIWIETMSRIKERLLTEPCCAAAVICQSNLWIAPLNMAWMVIWYVSGSITHFISRCFCENLLLTTVLKSDNRPMRLTLLGKYTSFFFLFATGGVINAVLCQTAHFCRIFVSKVPLTEMATAQLSVNNWNSHDVRWHCS